MKRSTGPGEVRRLFDLVCDMPTSHREARLRAEGVDADMIAEIEALVASQGTLVARARAPAARLLEGQPETELDVGDAVGAWRLLRRIASGGMGAVYLAERADGHFEQVAAVKLIRGTANADTFTLFARERQILATLQHPNIARLLDGGATPGGQPYLVMEYVEGAPIDRYCDAHKLGLRERLELFRAVCAAVQFAHQRLIVHCDLKPSNVLVREDGTPVLLDFGIARALDRPRVADADANYFTPGYASPEQLRESSVTTASDVYALGLILFELVAGRKARVDTADHTVSMLARAEVRPSQLVSDVPWRNRVAGDLDAIVLRATADQPADRYASAQGLGDDLGRYLEHRPVLAQAQTLRYRSARLLRRRWPLALASAAAALLVAVFTWRLAVEGGRARAAEREARQQAATAGRVSDFLVSVFNVSNPTLTADGRDVSARQVLDEGAARIDAELADSPRVKAHMLATLATAYRHLGEPREAIKLFNQAIALYLAPQVDEPLKAAEALSQLAVVYSNNEYPAADSQAAARRSLELRTLHAPGDDIEIADSWNTLGLVLEAQGNYAEAETALLKALELRRGIDGGKSKSLSSTLHNLALMEQHRGNHAKAFDYFRQSLALKRELGGELTPDYQNSLQGYATALAGSGRPEQALPLHQRNLELCRELFGERGTKYAEAHNTLAFTLHDLGRFNEAVQHYTEAMRIQATASGESSTSYAIPLNNLAYAYEDLGDFAQAIPLYERSLAIRRSTLGDTEPPVLRALQNLARALIGAGRLQDARAPLEAALAGMRARYGEDDANTAKVELVQADWELRSGRIEKAQATLALLQASGARFTPLMFARRDALAAEIASTRGDLAQALQKRRAAYEIMRDAHGAAHPFVAQFALDYAEALSARGQSAQAGALLDPLRPLIESTFAPGSPIRLQLAQFGAEKPKA